MSPEVTESPRDQKFELLRKRLVSWFRVSRAREFADDLAHKAIQLLLEKYPEVQDEGELLAIALKIKQFLLLETSRKGREEQPPENGWESVDYGPNPEQTLGVKEQWTQLMAAVNQLCRRCKEVILGRLRKIPSPELADRLGVAVNNLYQIEKRCLEQLRAITPGAAGRTR